MAATTDLFIVSVLFEGGGMIKLVYKHADDANKTRDRIWTAGVGTDDLTANLVAVADDYGVSMNVDRDYVMSIIVEDVRQTQEGQHEMQLMAARGQAALQSKAAADPMLRFAAAGQQGPGFRMG